MRLHVLLCTVVLIALSGCGTDSTQRIAQFWRPISEPNVEMPLGKGQKKLEFDLSQCHCGIYPSNVTQDQLVEFQKDRQQLAATGVTITPSPSGECMQQPSLVVTECMRQRGWEPTNCTGRMPLTGGGSLCTAFSMDQSSNVTYGEGSQEQEHSDAWYAFWGTVRNPLSSM